MCVDDMHKARLVVLSLILFVQRYNAFIEDEVKRCVTDCNKKISSKTVCSKTCEDKELQGWLKKAKQDGLPTPGAPMFISSSFTSIRVRWNATALSNLTSVTYVLEVKPNWTSWAHYGNNTVYPFIEKYHQVKDVIYSVRDLPANSNYNFRVLAVVVTENSTSSFSEWSDSFNTSGICTDKCTVTNLQLQLSINIPYKGRESLNGTFSWRPSPKNMTEEPYDKYIKVKHLTKNTFCRFGDTYEKKGNKDWFNRNASQHKFETNMNPRRELYFHCWYKVIIGYQPKIFGDGIDGSWLFQIPGCINTSNTRVCGCKDVKKEKGDSIQYRLHNSTRNTSTAVITWDDSGWRNDIQVKYFYIRIASTINRIVYPTWFEQYVDFYEHKRSYNITVRNLTNGKDYSVFISAYHSDHCAHGKSQEKKIKVVYPCKENPECPANETCQAFEGIKKCVCAPDFVTVNGSCVDSNPCRHSPCSGNKTCREGPSGSYFCSCPKGTVEKDEVCQAIDICKIDPDARGCGPTVRPEENSNEITIVISVAIPLVIVIVICLVAFWCVRRKHKRRLHTLENVMESVLYNGATQALTMTNPYDYQHPARVTLPPESGKDFFEDEKERELNVLYVPQEISEAIAKGLTDGLFEIPTDRLHLKTVIGKGAFGQVYVGEAHELRNSPGLTTIAVKKLADSANAEEVQDFLGEIMLMKTLGKHENVIQMYGCCTVSPPICLVMEYAPGGNLLEYLRTLKRKCERETLMSEDPNTKEFSESEKDKFGKFFEPGEIPEGSASFSFPLKTSDHLASPTQKLDNNNDIKEREARNIEIAARVNETIKTALDPKELESFARQIANGMTHVADLGIIHRDLAARNILLGENNVLKISDFGLSREGTYVKKTGGKIPLRWLSVEAILERRYSTASDVWAFGVVLWEICTLGDVPYPGVSDKDLVDFLITGKRMKKAASCTDRIFEVMLKCWSHRPEDRPTFAELSAFLWKLEHEGNTYVNLEQLLQSLLSAVEEDTDSTEEMKQAENTESDSDLSSQALLRSDKGVDNPGFWQSVEDLKEDDQLHIIPHKDETMTESRPDGNT